MMPAPTITIGPDVAPVVATASAKPGWTTWEAMLTALSGSLASAIVAAVGAYWAAKPATTTATAPPAVVATSPTPTPTPPAITPPPNAVPALHLTVVTGGRSTSAAQGLDALAASLGDGLIAQSYDGTVLYQGKLPDAQGLIALVRKLRGTP